MCDIMSASFDQYGSTPSHPWATAICHKIVLPEYGSASAGARWTRKDPTRLRTLQHCSAFSETFTFRFLSQLPQTLRTRGLFSAWHLCFEGYTKYPTTTLTTWRTAHDLKRGIAGASGSGLTNPGKKGDHLSQDLKRTATGVYGVQWVWDPKCDDMLMMLLRARGR